MARDTELSERDLQRIEVTVAVTDTETIPKVANAGAVERRGSESVQVMHNGVLVTEGCYYGSVMTEVIRRLRGHHEPQEERVVHEILQRLRAPSSSAAPVVVELGAYWAYYSLWAAAALPDVRNILVEPDRKNLEVGRHNFELNGRVGTFVRAAVGRIHKDSVLLQTESDGFRRTPTVTVDGLITDLGLGGIDVLFCDVQGAELEMLRGAESAIRAGRIRFAVISTHHYRYSGDPLTHQRCLDRVRALGGHVLAEHSVFESCSGDGLIAVSFAAHDTDLEIPITYGRARDSVFGEPEYEVARAAGGAWSPRRYFWRAKQRVLLGLMASRERARRANRSRDDT